jgi:hypothetical protein
LEDPELLGVLLGLVWLLWLEVLLGFDWLLWLD